MTGVLHANRDELWIRLKGLGELGTEMFEDKPMVVGKRGGR